MYPPLVFQKFLPKYSENQKCATPLDWKFRYKISIKNVLRPSFASLSLSTFPPRGRLNYCLISEASPCLKKNSVNFIFFGKNCQPLRGFPSGGSCLRSGLMRGSYLFSLIRDYRYYTRPLFFRNFFRNIQKIKNVLRPLIENFDIKFQSKMSCAPHSLRFRSAPSPQGEG